MVAREAFLKSKRGAGGGSRGKRERTSLGNFLTQERGSIRLPFEKEEKGDTIPGLGYVVPNKKERKSENREFTQKVHDL